jgi:hypothetical protein
VITVVFFTKQGILILVRVHGALWSVKKNSGGTLHPQSWDALTSFQIWRVLQIFQCGHGCSVLPHGLKLKGIVVQVTWLVEGLSRHRSTLEAWSPIGDYWGCK